MFQLVVDNNLFYLMPLLLYFLSVLCGLWIRIISPALDFVSLLPTW